MQLNDVDLIMASLEFAIGGIGGFCVGTSYVVEHQTLAGLGNFSSVDKLYYIKLFTFHSLFATELGS